MSEAALSRQRVPAGSGAFRLLSDEQLVRRAVKGDERAFAAIFRRYRQPLYRYCLAVLGSPEDAQDALQNTMVKALRALPGEERRIELKPWLYRVAHNESIDLTRRRRETRPLDPEQAGTGAGLAETAAARERLRRLVSDLEELPERQRGALVMRELSGLDFGEIGTALGTSAAAARQTVYEARLSLRRMDEGREMGCDTVTQALSDVDGRVARRRDIRAHLRACPGCRRFREEIAGRERDLAALSPLPAVAAAAVLQGLFGGGGAGGGGLAATLGGGAAPTLGAAAAVKATATIAVVAALGTAAADRAGLVDAGLPGGRTAETSRASEPAGVPGTGAAATLPAAGDAADIAAARQERAGVRDRLETRAGARRRGAAAPGPHAAKTARPDRAATPPGHSPAHAPGSGSQWGLPSASAHGQQTAAAHKGGGHGGGGRGQPTHPSKPAHPTHPSKPAHAVKPAKPDQPPNPESEQASLATAEAGSKPEAQVETDPQGTKGLETAATHAPGKPQ